MSSLFIVSILILVVAIVMTMVGKGGGNFYVLILALADVPMHQAATTGQFILFAASVAAFIVFQKHKSLSWPLAIFIGGVTSLSAFVGGYFSHLLSGYALKLIFGIMLIIAGIVMFIPVSEKEAPQKKQFGTIYFNSAAERFRINLWIALPATVLTGLASGMVGVSGGSFLVPLMVLTCGVSMHKSVGTASILIAAITLMGFSGHAVQGHFDPSLAIPLAFVTVLGGTIGGKFALRSKPKHLKSLFAFSNLLAAAIMLVNALMTKGS